MKLSTALFVSLITIVFAGAFGSPSHAQGAFGSLSGNWSGSGTIALEDGSTERIRCRAVYAVGAGGAQLSQNLICASDSYKFDLRSNVVAKGAVLSGTWGEASRNVTGDLQGRASGGQFDVVVSSPVFTANLLLLVRGNKQTISIRSASQFREVAISLTRS